MSLTAYIQPEEKRIRLNGWSVFFNYTWKN